MKPYPAWVCARCGVKHGANVPEGHISTWHAGTCGVCGKKSAVTEPRDFGHLKDGWQMETKGPHAPPRSQAPA